MQDDAGGQGPVLAPVGVQGGEQEAVRVLFGQVGLAVVAADPGRSAADDDAVAEGVEDLRDRGSSRASPSPLR